MVVKLTDQKQHWTHPSTWDTPKSIVYHLILPIPRKRLDDFDILEMVNLIVQPLRTGELTSCYGPQPSKKRKSNGDDDGGELIRIRGQDGTSVYPRAEGKQQRVRQQSCFVCRKYKYKPQNTQWMCRHCGMPLCSLSRGRDRDCLREHQNSECKFI